MAFSIDFVPLSPRFPGRERIAVIPWDSEFFGFNVGQLTLGSGRVSPTLSTSVASWAKRHRVELVSVVIPAEDHATLSHLQRHGFRVVDLALHPMHSRYRTIPFPKPRFRVRIATPSDLPRVARIAQHGFTFGRYHTDARFPKKIADLRYKLWIEHTDFARKNSLLYVVEHNNDVLGFHHIELEGTHADLRLAAVDKSSNFLGLGYSLYAGSLAAIKELGATTAEAAISAANTNIANMFVTFGFQLKRPEYILHWHSTHAPNLLP